MAASRHERRWAAGHFGGVGPTIPVFEKFEGRQVLLVERWEFFTQKPLLPREARKIHYRGFEFCEFGRVWVAPWYSLRRFRAASTSQRVGKQPPKSHFSQEKRDEFTIEAKTIGKPEHHAIFLRKFTLSGVFGARNEAPLMIGCLPFAWRGKPGTFQQKTIVSREASIAGEDRRCSCCRPRAENRRLRGTPNRPPTTTATTNPGRLSTFE